MARMNLADVQAYGERQMKKLFTKPSGDDLRILRQNVDDMTHSYSSFEDIVRLSQNLFNVHIFRDTSNIGQGIYVFGREDRVIEFTRWIKMVITRIEMDTLLYGNPVKRKSKFHGNRAYSKYRSKKCQQVLRLVVKLHKWKMKNFTKDLVVRGIVADMIIMQASRSEFSVLKNKTKYYGELRYTP
jgi:hypothetical protein